ncbi:MAG: 2-C-methyl-D-erythritol 4-phosphate cytidylyltransferase [Clostridiales bacterium]|jgi:2-C-methyl-D-erythritol 4-phosphate cytidylyltransferase|nr:2-C-methyl-D-erythritol 4-phosphate cytidylyltransferase [Clostridiales bacterium]
MNIALIFAGGTGIRMNSRSLPKQFLQYAGKPLIIYTLDQFDAHPEIDAIAVVCLKGWETELKKSINRWQIEKVKWIVEGGETSQESIYNGLLAIEESGAESDSVILIHDGVRPLIDDKLISANIKIVRNKGNCITVAREHETFIQLGSDGMIKNVGDRGNARVAKAPQSFKLSDILAVHRQARGDCIKSFIDSASLMFHYGKALHTTECDIKNIKVTTSYDYYIFKALYEVQENSQLLES